MRRLNAFLSRKEKEGRRDKEKEKEAAVQPKAPAAAPPVPAKPAVGSVTAAGDGSPAPRQVAFASEVERRSAPLEFYDEAPATSADAAGPSVNIDDAQSVLSHHGGPSHGLACFPVRGASPQTGSPIPVPSQPLQRRSSLNNPHPRSEGLTVGHGAAATLRAPRLSATSPIRGDIPRFSDPNERSATSLSQHTTASTSSSSFGSHSHGHGFYSGTTSPSSTAYYPNLAILATYARDINNAQQDRGTSTGMAQHLTWSEITDGELVENLGERERTRQEVLFEMVCSEERYVQELLSLKENYLDPLLQRHLADNAGALSHDNTQTVRSLTSLAVSHDATVKTTASLELRRPPLLELAPNSMRGPHRPTSPSLHPGYASKSRASHSQLSVAQSPTTVQSGVNASADHLPIAARFARRTSVDSTAGHAASTTTTRTTATDAHSHSHASPGLGSSLGYDTSGSSRTRRDISGGTTASEGTTNTGQTSLQSDGTHGELGAGPSTSATHAWNSTASKQSLDSRLHNSLFMHSNASRNAGSSNPITDAPTSQPDAGQQGHSGLGIGSVHIPRAFRHHLKALAPPPPNKLHKASIPDLSRHGSGSPAPLPPVVLPTDLRMVCETIADGLLEGHTALSARLRARYEEQYPLVRTLADVFTDQTWLVQHYAAYVLHLEQALQDVKDVLDVVQPLLIGRAKKLNDKDVLREQKRLARAIMRLEEEAAVRGVPGLAICLSQPFQRLLKYPLLFQSLLYHTDPSTRDYDATQALAYEIDAIVKSIENEKVSEEDRARTRDCWARIEGVNDRALLTPRPDRLLLSEAAMWAPSPAPGLAAARRTFSDTGRNLKSIEEAQSAAAELKPKKSSRRLSDLLPGERHKQTSSGRKSGKEPSVGSKRDVWLVSFTDVVIRCQRVGITKLPLSSAQGAAHPGGSRYVSLARTERNLYRYLKVDHWVMADETGTPSGRAGIVSMDDVAKVARRRSERIEEDPLSESEAELAHMEGSAEFDHSSGSWRQRKPTNASGGESRMSFTYTSDEPRPAFDVDPLIGLVRQPPATAPLSPTKRVAAPANGSNGKRNVSAGTTSTQDVARRQGLANAKFSNRMRATPQTLGKNIADTGRIPAPAGRMRAVSPTAVTSGFNKPTAAYLARAGATAPQRHGGPQATGASSRRPDTASPLPLPDSKRVRSASSNTTASLSPVPSPPPSVRAPLTRRRSFSSVDPQGGAGGKQLRTKHSSEKLGMHGNRRQGASDIDSGVALFHSTSSGV